MRIGAVGWLVILGVPRAGHGSSLWRKIGMNFNNLYSMLSGSWLAVYYSRLA